tara:strand:- start:373 stop:1074 length:702 start_codon:yes stop_codon:yes gene_type:complete
MIKTIMKKLLFNIGNSLNKNILPEYKASVIERVKSESKKQSAEFIASNLSNADVFEDLSKIHMHIISKINRSGLILEFGVYSGRSIKRFSKKLYNMDDNRTIYGFDSYKGLQEDWTGAPGIVKGSFKTNPPKLPSNVQLVIGLVQETFEDFLKDTEENHVAFIHLDMDTYTPTKYVLEKAKPYFQKGTIILFDELYGYPNWQNHEYLALTETLKPDEYEFILFGNEQCAIRIL